MLVDVRNLSKTYRAPDGGDSVPVLRELVLAIQERDTIAVVGPSGSGKSTLLNIIGALDHADTGEVFVGGRNVAQLNEADAAAYRNQEVGFIFQLHHLLPQCTVLENVLVPTLARKDRNHGELHARAEQLLDSVGLKHRLQHRPGELSGGERQRVAVARALINKPRLVLADEPTGALDRVSAERLVELLVQLNATQGVTLVMVTHAADIAARMQRVMELRDGRLVDVPHR
jgi:ABC-type lipoprotein export system ATPase subunit